MQHCVMFNTGHRTSTHMNNNQTSVQQHNHISTLDGRFPHQIRQNAPPPLTHFPSYAITSRSPPLLTQPFDLLTYDLFRHQSYSLISSELFFHFPPFSTSYLCLSSTIQVFSSCFVSYYLLYTNSVVLPSIPVYSILAYLYDLSSLHLS